jgi:hypothetical protein
MSQPLDFSAGGRKPAAAPPQQAPRRRGPGAKKGRLLLALVALLAAAGFLAVVVFDVFAEEDTTGAALDHQRYCQLARELDQVSVGTGAASAAGVYDGDAEKIKAAVDQMGPTLAELRSVAPPPVDDDVAAVTRGLERAGDGDAGAVQGPTFREAALRASRYHLTNCSSGASGGD